MKPIKPKNSSETKIRSSKEQKMHSKLEQSSKIRQKTMQKGHKKREHKIIFIKHMGCRKKQL
jgi:hypothetical protein